MGFYIGQTYGNVINYVFIGNWLMYYSIAYEYKKRDKILYRLWLKSVFTILTLYTSPFECGDIGGQTNWV